MEVKLTRATIHSCVCDRSTNQPTFPFVSHVVCRDSEFHFLRMLYPCHRFIVQQVPTNVRDFLRTVLPTVFNPFIWIWFYPVQIQIAYIRLCWSTSTTSWPIWSKKLNFSQVYPGTMQSLGYVWWIQNFLFAVSSFWLTANLTDISSNLTLHDLVSWKLQNSFVSCCPNLKFFASSGTTVSAWYDPSPKPFGACLFMQRLNRQKTQQENDFSPLQGRYASWHCHHDCHS